MNQRKSWDKGAPGSRKEPEAGSQSRGVKPESRRQWMHLEMGTVLIKETNRNPRGFWARIRGALLSTPAFWPAAAVQETQRDPSFAPLFEGHELGALELPGGLVLEKDDCAMYESLLFLEIASAFRRPCYSETHPTNLIWLYSQANCFFLTC